MPWKRSAQNPGPSAGEFTGFLDKSVRLEGTLEFPGTFRLEAQVKGTIISSQTLMLGEAAQVQGQIEGNHVVICGRFDGVIFAKGRVEIQTKAIVTGEIHTLCLVIEPGGAFEGQCHMAASSEGVRRVIISIRAAPQS
jgi:cytoskeletal protein CcmA (bactofilin family)